MGAAIFVAPSTKDRSAQARKELLEAERPLCAGAQGVACDRILRRRARNVGDGASLGNSLLAAEVLRMPRQGRKVAKSVSTPPQRTPVNGSSCQRHVNKTTSVDYSVLKRAQLQQHCKKLGIRATGKALPAVTPVDLTNEIKTEASEDKTDLVRGWCVVHGMVLYRPASSWSPLLLRGGMVCVQDGENVVPFHLPPLNISVPDGLPDNYVCEDCVLRNQQKPKRCPLCQQISGKGHRVSLPKIALKNLTTALDSTARTSLLETSISRDKRRTTEIRKLYQPQEDQAYAQRVDGLLSQMARGELGMDRALRPLQPLVVHSPAPFER
ncbi:hypothetical protein JD844_002758 [Phrynosoma platyrhinos]|uniref:Developmental pluripotency-associated protein 2/4 C-terminal domain-containing protein n=1 Tax=Phrynosoma platyrhinos TaxID=52577 RepID=A0ABQ7TBY6_PHRPL|nr:hypothetical protein JD844_002758 [Phrynosoma platyrhinos]